MQRSRKKKEKFCLKFGFFKWEGIFHKRRVQIGACGQSTEEPLPERGWRFLSIPFPRTSSGVGWVVETHCKTWWRNSVKVGTRQKELVWILFFFFKGAHTDSLFFNIFNVHSSNLVTKILSQNNQSIGKREFTWNTVVFFITQWIYYIYSCTMIITIQFYRISIPQPQHIPLFLKRSALETVSFSKSVSQCLFCKKVHSVLFSDSTCQWKHWMLVSHCMADFTSMIVSRSIHVAKHTGISFLLMAE